MEIISNIALITINETLIVQAVSFLVFVFLFNRIMIAPLRTAIQDRNEYVSRIRTDILAAKRKISDLTDQISTEEQNVKKAAFGLYRELETAGTRSAADIISQTRQTITGEKEKIAREVEASIAAARESVQAEAEALAVTVMEKILNRGLGR